jgi:hypothetical protein
MAHSVNFNASATFLRSHEICERVIDMMIVSYLKQWEKNEMRNPDLTAWLERFRADKFAARGYWQAIRDGVHADFRDGAEAIPDNFTPG